MAKFSFTTLTNNFKTLLHHPSADDVRPDLAWNIILTFFLVAFISTSACAYFVYRWAIQDDLLNEVPPAPITTISREEITAVLSGYEKKRVEYDRLREGGSVDTPDVIGIKNVVAPEVTPGVGQ